MLKSKIIAHRGVFDNEKVVENTLESFKKAIHYHYPIELDVQLTNDHQMVVFHDEDILRLTGKKGIVQEMNYEELVKLPLLNTKSHIPLLKEVLELNHDQEYIDIEIKPTKNIYDTVFYLMKELNGYHKYVIKSFDPRIIRFIKKHYPDVSAGLLIQNQYDHFLEKAFLHSTLALIYSKCDFVAISKKVFKNKKMMKKYRGYPVLVWTIQDGEEINYQDSISYICNNLPYKNKKDS